MPQTYFYNKESVEIFRNLLRYNKTNLRFSYQLLKTIYHQKKAIKRRELSEKNGVNVPPILMLSITKNCNLNCKGCYQKSQERITKHEMSEEKIISVLKEADVLGSSIVVILGGEPLLRKDIFRITAGFKNMIIGLFTNGQLIDQNTINNFKKNRSIIPIISIEGTENETDYRRGEGVYKQIKSVTELFKQNNIPYGLSLTATRKNFEIITNESYIKSHTDLGCILFFYIDYIPVKGLNNDLILNDEQSKFLRAFYNTFRRKYKALCLAAAAEENLGGCLGAGRGLIHINYDGSVEPCPFSPISEKNLHDTSLKDALNSQLFKQIRENHGKLQGQKTGSCTLWDNKEIVSSYLEN